MITKGDYYIDCGQIPRFCINADEDIEGISLVDGSIGFCSVHYCKPKKVTMKTAINWRVYGPRLKKQRKDLKLFYESEWGGGRKIWWTETGD